MRSKRKRQLPPLPRLVRRAQRLIFMNLSLGLDRIFRETIEETGFNAREILEMRPVFQCVMANHAIGKRSTAQHIAKAIGIPRSTVRRCLDALVRVGWLANSGSHYWVSAKSAQLPVMPRTAYRKGAKLIEEAYKQLRARRRKK